MIKLTKKHFLYVIAFLLCFWSRGSSQTKDISFKHLSVKEGLSQSPIFSLFQDKKGFVWIGNREGLIRYDGYEFKKYTNENVKHQIIIHNDIRAIYEDKYDRLWIGTLNGLYLFDRKTERFLHTELSAAIMVTALVPDHLDKLWIATNNGLKCLKLSTTKLVSVNYSGNFSHQIKNGKIESLFLDNKQQLWIGQNTGVKCIDPYTGAMIKLPNELAKNGELQNSRVFKINQDSEGELWFATENVGVFRFNWATHSCLQYRSNGVGTLPSDFVRDIFSNGAETVWFGTRNGLSIFDKRKNSFINYKHDGADQASLSHNTIWKFMKDDAGNVWLGTYAGGLNIFNETSHNFENIGERIGEKIGLNIPVVNAILVENEGSLWLGTDGGGLNYLNTKTNVVQYFSVKNNATQKFSDIVKALAKDNDNNILVGTLDGLATFNGKNKTVKYFDFKHDKTKNIRVNTLLNDNGTIWVGTAQDGLKAIRPNGSYETFMPSKMKDSISDNYVSTFVKDDRGNLWIATNKGLNYFDQSLRKFRKYDVGENGSKENFILSLYLDKSKGLWVGTANGLYLFNSSSGKFFKLQDEQGLLSQSIHAMIVDKGRNLWASTSNGLNKLSFTDFKLPFDQAAYQVINYSVNDGLISNQFLLNAVAKGINGELFFGGVNGLSSVFSEHIVKNRHQPKLAITEFLVHNRSVKPLGKESPLVLPIEETRTITLNHDQNYITFKFTALNFVNAQNNQYAYVLEGLKDNEEWHYVGNQRVANYTNLEAGKYTFKLKAANNDGVWSNHVLNVQITVLPPYWKTWWAYLIYLTCTAVVVYQIIKFFRDRAKLKYELYMEHLENQRQEEIHQLKLDFFTNVSHEIRTPLTLISGPLERLTEEICKSDPSAQQQLGLIRKNADRLLKLVSELLDFRKVETGNMKIYVQKHNIVTFLNEMFDSFRQLAQSRGINYEFNVEEKQIEVYFDGNQLEKVIINLLANAFKFTPDGGLIKLSVRRNLTEVTIIVSDSGAGIDQPQQEKLFTLFYQTNKAGSSSLGSGIGLALSKSIVDLHKGHLTVSSAGNDAPTGQETSFILKLLLGKVHFSQTQLGGPDQISDSYASNLSYLATGQTIEEVSTGAIKSYTVLLIEDNDELRAFIKSAVIDRYHVLEAENGIEGVALATESIPDLIISDVMMPEMDGLELTTKLKMDERTSHIPIILLTARSAEVHQVHGLETGADLYITKPFNVKILLLNIKNLLNTRARLREKFASQFPFEQHSIEISTTDQKFLDKVLKFIDEQMAEPEFSVPSLASAIGMSQPVLYKKMKALTNMSVNDYIKSIRLKKAAQLLRQNELTIYEISYAVGFNDSKYFSREFTKQFAQNPSTYRNEAKSAAHF